MIAEIPINADLPPVIPWDMIGLGAFGAVVVGVALYFSWRIRMVVVVSASRTVLPPFDPRDDNPIFDETGRPLIGGFGQTILDAIHQLDRRIDHMSGTVSQQLQDMAAQLKTANDTAATAIAASEASDAAIKADLTAIQAKLAALPDAPTPEDIAAVKAQVDAAVANAAAAQAHAADDASVETTAHGIATGTGTATSTST